MKYAKAKEIMQAKIEVKERVMDGLMTDNGIPILKGQKKLQATFEF